MHSILTLVTSMHSLYSCQCSLYTQAEPVQGQNTKSFDPHRLQPLTLLLVSVCGATCIAASLSFWMLHPACERFLYLGWHPPLSKEAVVLFTWTRSSINSLFNRSINRCTTVHEVAVSAHSCYRWQKMLNT